MKILLTGASGFLGKTIKRVLQEHKMYTLARSKADIIVNLKKDLPNLPAVDLILHVAGKAHYFPKTTKQEKEFYEVNVNGTKNFLLGIENSPSLPNSFIFISSVAVYGLEFGNLIGEETNLIAKDAYGKSKIQAENLVRNWCLKNNITCTILRLPLLAGSNPPGNLASMIKGISKGFYFNIAGGKAQKSIVLAEDVAKIIPVVANIGGIYNLTDRYHPTFLELSELVARQLGKSRPLNIPKWIASLMAKVGDLVGSKAPINSRKLNKITSDLTFDDSKAVAAFGWNPTPVLQGFKIK